MSILTAARRSVKPAAATRVLFDSARIVCPTAYQADPADRVIRFSEAMDVCDAVADRRATLLPMSWANYRSFADFMTALNPPPAAAPAPAAKPGRTFEPSAEDRSWWAEVQDDEERTAYHAHLEAQAEMAEWYDANADHADEMLAVGACG